MYFIGKKDKLVDISFFFAPVEHKIIVTLRCLKSHIQQLVFYLGRGCPFTVKHDMQIGLHTLHVMIRIHYLVLNRYDSAPIEENNEKTHPTMRTEMG
jgi:hypothetical protein